MSANAQNVNVPKELVKKDQSGLPKLKVSEINQQFQGILYADTTEESSSTKTQRWRNYEFSKANIRNDSTYTYDDFNKSLKLWTSSPLNCQSNDPAEWKSIGPIDQSAQRRGWTDGVFVKPTNPQEIIIGTRTSGLMKSNNGGVNWSPVTENLGTAFLGCRQIIGDPTNSNIVYALSGSNMYKGSFFRSTDGGNNWQTMFQDADFVWMSFLENAPECMLALNEKNEFYYSTNQGVSWISLGQIFSAFDSSPNNDFTDLRRISLVAGKLIVYGEEQYAPNRPFYIANTTYNNGVLNISNQQLGTDFLFGVPLQNHTFVIGVGVSNRVNNQVYMTLVLKDTTDNVSPIYTGFSYKLNSNSISVVNTFNSTSDFTTQYGSSFPLYSGIGLTDKYELIQSINEPNKYIYHACVYTPKRYEINVSTSLINPQPVELNGLGHHEDYRCSYINSFNGVDNIYFGNDGGVAKYEYANNLVLGNNLLSINGDLSNNLIHYFDLDESTKNIAMMFQDMDGKIMLPNGSFSNSYGWEGSAVMMSHTWNGKLVT